MKNKLSKIIVLLAFLFVTTSLSAKEDELPPTELKFSVFQDTIVCGFDTEIQLKSGYDLKKLSITATGCSIMLKDAEKGIYVVNAPVSSVGKISEITVSLVSSNGSVRVIETFKVPIVSMSTEMKKRYVNNLKHKK